MEMKAAGKTVAEIKAFAIEEKKRMAAEIAGSIAGGPTYTLDQLRKRPADLDQTKLESYLSDAEFMKAFGMTKTAYNGLPKWKQADAKKKLGIN